MSDILDRLGEIAPGIRLLSLDLAQILNECAAEIGRLRTALQPFAALADQMADIEARSRQAVTAKVSFSVGDSGDAALPDALRNVRAYLPAGEVEVRQQSEIATP